MADTAALRLCLSISGRGEGKGGGGRGKERKANLCPHWSHTKHRLSPPSVKQHPCKPSRYCVLPPTAAGLGPASAPSPAGRGCPLRPAAGSRQRGPLARASSLGANPTPRATAAGCCWARRGPAPRPLRRSRGPSGGARPPLGRHSPAGPAAPHHAWARTERRRCDPPETRAAPEVPGGTAAAELYQRRTRRRPGAGRGCLSQQL